MREKTHLGYQGDLVSTAEVQMKIRNPLAKNLIEELCR